MFRRLPVLLCALAGASSLLQAQTSLTGPVSDSTTGPLASGQVYHVPTGITVIAGQTLTVQPGAIVKFGAGAFLHVPGTLDVQGSALSPAIFTSLADDSAGGDTNGDGPSSGAPGDWTGVVFQAGSAGSTLAHAELRFAGSASATALRLTSADAVSCANLLIRDCLADGLSMDNAGPAFSATHFQDVGGAAIGYMPIEAVAACSGLTAAGTGLHRMTLSNAQLDGNVALTPANTLNADGVLYAASGLGINGALTLAAGMIVKVGFNQEVGGGGVLTVDGTAGQPVRFTSFADDTVGGDENGDGPSTGTAGDWRRIHLSGPTPSTLTHCEVRFAGQGSNPGVWVQSEQILDHVTVRDCQDGGLLVLNDPPMTVRDCHFEDNGGLAIRAGTLNEAHGFLDNTAANNAGGNAIEYAATVLDRDQTLGRRNGIGGVLTVSGDVIVPPGFRLTMQPGSIWKANGPVRWTVNGALDVLGTEIQPVVFTSFADDQGADSNGDGGVSSPAKGDWRGLIYNDVAAGSIMEHAELRYTGGGFLYGVDVRSPAVQVRHVAVRYAFADAFNLTAFADARHLTAYDCRRGFDLTGAGDLERATAVRCALVGFRKAGGSTHVLVDSIAWNNTLDFSGFAGPDLRYTNGAHGLAGVSGNIDANPLFVDEPNGDLRLTAGSPCIDAGDPLSPLDPDATRADMGAAPFDHCQPVVFCTAKTNSQGCTPQVAFAGRASASDPSAFDVSASQVLNQKNGLLFYGYGAIAAPFLGGTLCAQPPLRRTPVQGSLGNAGPDDCSGAYKLDFNAWIQGGSDPFLVPGAQVAAQYWSRDPAHVDGTGAALTDAVLFGVCP